ncbi:DoxX family protein [Capnocytophaga catalasegens]|uniref:GntR family transcriptional regulator n=1 Tax=Capnocytophaga catalasegens TaxID=1004260 RepID=A0AAV5AXF5_9FLAO|nr:DoxX family protein [Capnocytophaga catalasegens]GIZ15457.1 GntR family transcriptional regulator [Capnocytophaga catalasegens]GJM51045.1 GntR family transcriptional regulator [Capnocytophaga catalasegens]GJM52230.1 GntR family transcriptional regulator [Capnocytophaga catalasegens]
MKNVNLGLLIMRLSVGVLMLLHGIAKLNGVGHIKGMLENQGLPTILAYGAYLGEIVAPLLLIVGYRTRFAALMLVINCIAIIFLGGYSVLGLGQYGGWSAELPGLFLFGALALFFTGGGKYALSTKSSWD